MPSYAIKAKGDGYSSSWFTRFAKLSMAIKEAIKTTRSVNKIHTITISPEKGKK